MSELSNDEWWAKTRHPEQEYNRRKAIIERDGIWCNLRWQETVWPEHDERYPFYSLRVEFPPDFRHLIVQEAQDAKEALPEGYHISIGNKWAFIDNAKMLRRLSAIYLRFRDPVIHHFEHVRVTSGSAYELLGPDSVVWAIKDVVQFGTGKKDPHISLD